MKYKSIWDALNSNPEDPIKSSLLIELESCIGTEAFKTLGVGMNNTTVDELKNILSKYVTKD